MSWARRIARAGASSLLGALLAASPLSADDFLRGDANLDAGVSLADLTRILDALRPGRPSLPCADAGDTDDDGGVEDLGAGLDEDVVDLRT